MSIQTAVILGGGEILDYPSVAARIKPGDLLICADSGYDHCLALGLRPDYLIGDFDSVRAALPADIPQLRLPPEKNYTDSAHAIDAALSLGCQRMLLAGVLGGRLDHTLANLQSLAALSQNGIDACLTDGATDVFAVTDGALTLQPRPGCYFSLFPLSGLCEGVNIVGAKYLLHQYTLRFDEPRAVSNEFLDGPATVSVERGTMGVLCVPHNMSGC